LITISVFPGAELVAWASTTFSFKLKGGGADGCSGVNPGEN